MNSACTDKVKHNYHYPAPTRNCMTHHSALQYFPDTSQVFLNIKSTLRGAEMLSLNKHILSLYHLNRFQFIWRSSSRGNSKISLCMFSFNYSSVWWFILQTVSFKLSHKQNLHRTRSGTLQINRPHVSIILGGRMFIQSKPYFIRNKKLNESQLHHHEAIVKNSLRNWFC